jgi:hypothetical protein
MRWREFHRFSCGIANPLCVHAGYRRTAAELKPNVYLEMNLTMDDTFFFPFSRSASSKSVQVKRYPLIEQNKTKEYALQADRIEATRTGT